MSTKSEEERYNEGILRAFDAGLVIQYSYRDAVFWSVWRKDWKNPRDYARAVGESWQNMVRRYLFRLHPLGLRYDD